MSNDGHAPRNIIALIVPTKSALDGSFARCPLVGLGAEDSHGRTQAVLYPTVQLEANALGKDSTPDVETQESELSDLFSPRLEESVPSAFLP
jgi:hypothetical protein